MIDSRRRAFLEGMGSTLNLYPIRKKSKLGRSVGLRNDREAFQKDLKNIGKDMFKAITQWNANEKIKTANHR